MQLAIVPNMWLSPTSDYAQDGFHPPVILPNIGPYPSGSSAQQEALPKLGLLSNMGLLPYMELCNFCNMELETETQCDRVCLQMNVCFVIQSVAVCPLYLFYASDR